MVLDLQATKPPDVSFSTSGGNLTVFGHMSVNVVNPKDKKMQQAFVLGMVSRVSVVFNEYPLHCD